MMDGRNCVSLGPSTIANSCRQQSHRISPEKRERQSPTPAKSWKGKPTMTCEIPRWEWNKHAHQSYPTMYLLSPQRASVMPIMVDGIASILSRRDNTNKK